jgi:hypothetical protein
MCMIGWKSTILGTTWLLGLAVLLAGLRYWACAATAAGRPLREYVGETPAARSEFALGLALGCLAAGALRDRFWERVLWGVMCLLVAREGWLSWRELRHARDRPG